VDEGNTLRGTVSVRELLLAGPEDTVDSLMEEHSVFCTTTDDREAVAADFQKYGFSSIPVVDSEKRLVGIITTDDIIDVIQEETTEDIAKMNAVMPSEKPYMSENAFRHFTRRIGWLTILAVSGIVASLIMQGFEDVLDAVIILSMYVPFLMGTGGNAGCQASTLVIRGMAQGEISTHDFWRVFWKEMRVALLTAAFLVPVVFLKVRFLDLRPGKIDGLLVITSGVDISKGLAAVIVALTVCLSLTLAVVAAKIVGGVLPLIAKKCRMDPAVMASPLITTIVDASTLLIYFGLASVTLLPILGGA
jgi:magnesium transporter